MKNLYRQALAECATGNLRMTQDSDGHRLFCYTQSCFFGKDSWNEITKSHRGQLYYENKPVNKPFKKIFNVNEVPETDHELVCKRMANEDYEILDKANGHLFIVSMFKDSKGEQHVVFSTKGSLPNPKNSLLNDDIKIFNALYGEQMDFLCSRMPYLTLMFEAIVAHDQHSMYELQVEQYGSENCFVLLGASIGLGYEFDESEGIAKSSTYHSVYNKTTLEEDPWIECDWKALTSIAQIIGCPVVQMYDEVEGTPKMWKEHNDREGYVIHFLSDNSRVKIKTTEYWKNRFKKDLSPNNIISLYKRSGNVRLHLKLPEEIAVACETLFTKEYTFWYENYIIRLESEIKPFLKLYDGDFEEKFREWLFNESEFNNHQRQYIAYVIIDGSNTDDLKSKSLRLEFCKYALNSTEFCKKLEEVVTNAL